MNQGRERMRWGQQVFTVMRLQGCKPGGCSSGTTNTHWEQRMICKDLAGLLLRLLPVFAGVEAAVRHEVPSPASSKKCPTANQYVQHNVQRRSYHWEKEYKESSSRKFLFKGPNSTQATTPEVHEQSQMAGFV